MEIYILIATNIIILLVLVKVILDKIKMKSSSDIKEQQMIGLREIISQFEVLERERKQEIERFQRMEIELNKQIAENSANCRTLQDNILAEKEHFLELAGEKKTLLIAEKELVVKVAELTALNSALNDNILTQKAEVGRIQKELKTEFENIANKILEENSKKFSSANKDSIDTLLKPLGESIFDFKNQIKDNLTEETKQRSTLQQQVKTLVEQTNKVTQQAENLTSALKGKSKIRGNWGEMILESVLQQAGMCENREYYKQFSTKDEENNTVLFPDIVVNLPNNRKIIIDSKVSLVDYEMYSTCEDEQMQDNSLKRHISCVKLHIDSLSSKEYNKKVANSADFTMMFIPIEPAYMAAVQKDGKLWEYAYNRNIMLISPSNLLPCLKLISDMWRKELITQNAKEIVNRGEQLYNQLRLVMESYEKVGDAIDRAQSEFTTFKSRMTIGRGSLVWQAETLRKLGLKPTKLINGVEDMELLDSEIIEVK